MSACSSYDARPKRGTKRKGAAVAPKGGGSDSSSSEPAARSKMRRKQKKHEPKAHKRRGKGGRSSSSLSVVREARTGASSQRPQSAKHAGGNPGGDIGRLPMSQAGARVMGTQVLVAPNIWTPAAFWPGHLPPPDMRESQKKRHADTGHRSRRVVDAAMSESESESESSPERKAKSSRKHAKKESKRTDKDDAKVDRKKAAFEALKAALQEPPPATAAPSALASASHASSAGAIASGASGTTPAVVQEGQKRDKKSTKDELRLVREELAAAKAESDALRSQLRFEREAHATVTADAHKSAALRLEVEQLRLSLEDGLGLAARENGKLRARLKKAKDEELAARTKQRAATTVAVRIKQGSVRRLERRETQIQTLESALQARGAQIVALTAAREELLATVSRMKKRLSHRGRHEEMNGGPIEALPHITVEPGKSLLWQSSKRARRKHATPSYAEPTLTPNNTDAAAAVSTAPEACAGDAAKAPEACAGDAAKAGTAAPCEAAGGSSLRITFAGASELVNARQITSYRGFGDKLWFTRPNARVCCDRCNMRVPQAQGSLLSDPSRSQFMQEKFLCGFCAAAENAGSELVDAAKSGGTRASAPITGIAAPVSREAADTQTVDLACQLSATSAKAASAVAAAAVFEVVSTGPKASSSSSASFQSPAASRALEPTTTDDGETSAVMSQGGLGSSDAALVLPNVEETSSTPAERGLPSGAAIENPASADAGDDTAGKVAAAATCAAGSTSTPAATAPMASAGPAAVAAEPVATVAAERPAGGAEACGDPFSGSVG